MEYSAEKFGYEYEDSGHNYQLSRKAGKIVPVNDMIRFEDISEDLPDHLVPYLDRSDVDETTLSQEQLFWRRNGYLILRKFIPQKMVDKYLKLRERLNLGLLPFNNFTPYIEFDEIKDICLYKPLADMYYHLFGEVLGLHFILSQFHSTERGWHQDDYLNPPDIVARYVAAWISMGTVTEDVGPFEFVPGSNRWPCVRRHLIQRYLDPEVREAGMGGDNGTHWATYAECFVNPAYDEKIRRSGARIEKFLPEAGDLLIWHGRLIHRGSAPTNRVSPRMGMIAHYSSAVQRQDIGRDIRRHKDGGWYWNFDDVPRYSVE